LHDALWSSKGLLIYSEKRSNRTYVNEGNMINFRDVCYYSDYGGADKSLARPTSRCILFDGENISFDASLVIYVNSTNIPPILIINMIYETQNILSLQLVSFLVGLRTYQHPCKNMTIIIYEIIALSFILCVCKIRRLTPGDERYIVFTFFKCVF
jgi:hypothetical protein